MESVDLQGVNMNFRRGGLQAGTTNTFTTTVDLHYAIKGQVYSVAASSNTAPPVTDALTGLPFVPLAPSKACCFVFCADGSGLLSVSTKVIQGTIVDLTNETDGTDANYVSALSQWPAVPDTLTVFGWVIVKVGAGGAPWTFGVSNFSSVANTLVTFTNGSVLPDRPRSI